MQLNETEKRVLATLAVTLRERFSASEVLLYGSAARDELTDGSDIDLLVVLPEVTWELEKKIIDHCFRAQLECDRVISTACFGEEEIREGPLRASPFVLHARREGRTL